MIMIGDGDDGGGKLIMLILVMISIGDGDDGGGKLIC